MTENALSEPGREERLNDVLLRYVEAAQTGQVLNRRRLLAENPDLAADPSTVLDLAYEEFCLLRQAGLYPNPTAGYVRTDADQSGQSETAGVFLSQDIVTAGKLKVIGQAETVEIDLRRWQLKAQIDRVLSDVRTRYWEVLGAQQAMSAATELERLASEDLGAVRQLLEAKQASRPDLLQAEIHLNAVRSSLQHARLRHQAAWRQLANLVGVACEKHRPDVELDRRHLNHEDE